MMMRATHSIRAIATHLGRHLPGGGLPEPIPLTIKIPMTQPIFLSNLDRLGVDDFNRPVWQHTSSGVRCCLEDELYDRDDAPARCRAMEHLVAYNAALYV